jgi:hypothetical protein
MCQSFEKKVLRNFADFPQQAHSTTIKHNNTNRENNDKRITLHNEEPKWLRRSTVISCMNNQTQCDALESQHVLLPTEPYEDRSSHMETIRRPYGGVTRPIRQPEAIIREILASHSGGIRKRSQSHAGVVCMHFRLHLMADSQ